MGTEETEQDYSAYAGKAATALQASFADWVIDKLELTFSTKKEESAFREGIRLGTALRIPFQKSPENQEAREAAAAERAERPVAEKAPKAEKAVAEAKPAKRAKKAAPVEDSEPAEEAVAVTKASKPKKAARAGKVAPF